MSINFEDESYIKFPQVAKITNNNNLNDYYLKFPDDSKSTGQLTNDGNGLLNFTEKERYVIKDIKSNGTNGGIPVPLSWTKRDLNTLEKYPSSSTNISLNSLLNNFTLKEGMYFINVSSPAFRVGDYQIRLKNENNDSVICYGTSEYPQGNVTTRSNIFHIFEIENDTIFSIEYRCLTATRNNTQSMGLGRAVGNGFNSNEVYSIINIDKLK